MGLGAAFALVAGVGWVVLSGGDGVRRWPSFQFDAGNAGHVAGRTGPTAATELEHRWSTSLSESKGTEPAVVDGDTVYVATGAENGALHALSTDDGSERWRFTPAEDAPSTGFLSAPAIADGTVFSFAHTGTFHAVDAETGEGRWERDLAQAYNLGSPVVSDGTVYTLAGGYDELVAFSLSGEEQWRTDMEGNALPRRGPAIAAADGAVVVPVYLEDRMTIQAFDAATGDRVWRHRFDPDVPTVDDYRVASPSTDGAQVVVYGNDGVVRAVDAETGEGRWEYRVPGGDDDLSGKSSPAIAGDTVYVGTKNRQLHAVAVDDGSELWTHRVDWWILSAPVVVGDTVYVVDHNGKGYVVDGQTGSRQCFFEGGGNSGVSPAIQGRRIFVAGGNAAAFEGGLAGD